MDNVDVDIRKLIAAVKDRPVLWNMRHSEYNDKIERRNAWEEVVLLFVAEDSSLEEKKSVGEIVQKKWKNVRDRFARDFNLMKQWHFRNGSKRKGRYIYSQQLAFLNDVIENKAATSPSNDQRQPKHEYMDISSNEPDLTTPLKNPGPSTTPDKKFVKQKRLNEAADTKKLDVLNENIERQIKKEKIEEDDDDDRYFLLSLLPIMKTIPPQCKLVSRIELMETLKRFTPS